MKILKQDPAGISFMEILLDETICQGTIAVPWELAVQSGGYNQRLKAKRKYELILRIAVKGPVDFIEQELDTKQEKYLIVYEQETEESADDRWKADCYVIGKYSSQLQESGFFDQAVSDMLQLAENEGHLQQTLDYLEQMIRHGNSYDFIDSGSRPVLIYKGDPVCHNVLTVMAEQFGNALEQLGIPVIYFDCEKEEVKEVTKYTYQYFRAIVGVQSYMFSIRQKDEIHDLHDVIYGPKYNFVFDHPLWFQHHLKHHLKQFYILTNDSYYQRFYQKYYKKEAVFFPPAGIVPKDGSCRERIYDMTFVGEYGDYWNELLIIHQMERSRRFLANHFLLVMRRNPQLTAEEALMQTLSSRQITLTEQEFLDLFYELRRVIFCVMNYYRDRVLRVILKSGLSLHVFGNSWSRSPLTMRYSNLICHPDVSVEQSVAVWQQSKLSLNVMSWHKSGFTERMAGIMLAGAVLVTDHTQYLPGRYDSSDLLCFHLERLQELPAQIMRLLGNEQKRKIIAENGRMKTLSEHTWKKRAEQFLTLLEQQAERYELQHIGG